VTINEIESQEVPPDSEPMNRRSQRIHREACRCFFPARGNVESFGHWTTEPTQAERWTRLRRAFNDWLDAIHLKRDSQRAVLEFGARILDEADPFDHFIAQGLCRGQAIFEMKEQIQSVKSYRTIHWRCIQPKQQGGGRAVA
jgi:hypothetical protein